MSRVLLTDAQQRKTLAAVRSLGTKGVQVLSGEVTRWALARFSKYCRRGLVYPHPGKKPEEFYRWLKQTLQDYPCDVLLPMDDHTMEVVMSNRDSLEKLCRLPLPAVESYRIAADKALATIAAREAGLNCPETIYPQTIEEIPQLVSELNFPVVIKPRKSSGSRGIKVVSTLAELVPAYLLVHREYPFPIIQEYIPPGDKFDVCLLFNRSSQLRAAFVQKEIRFFPLENGPSTVQESVWYPELVEKATALLQQLNWYGVAEVEFMVDCRDGQPKFMEINPRFWGSLYMSMLAGVDFPWLLYRLAMEGDIEEVLTYTTGLKCRWSLPGDSLHFLVNKQRLAMDPPFISSAKSGVYDDILSFDDPVPTLGFFLACLRYLLDLEMWKFMFRR